MDLITRIQEMGYSFRQEHVYCAYTRTEHGCVRDNQAGEYAIHFLCPVYQGVVKNIIPVFDETVYFLGDSGTKNVDEADMLIKEGHGIKTTCQKIYEDYYHMLDNPDLHSYFLYGYSAKTKQYLDDIKQSIGLLRYSDLMFDPDVPDGEPSRFEPICIYLNPKYHEAAIGKIGSEYIAQLSFRVYDDFVILKFYFSRLPSEQEVNIAVDVRDIEWDFYLDRLKEIVFTCWEEDKTINWIDLPGDFQQKYNKLSLSSTKGFRKDRGRYAF